MSDPSAVSPGEPHPAAASDLAEAESWLRDIVVADPRHPYLPVILVSLNRLRAELDEAYTQLDASRHVRRVEREARDREHAGLRVQRDAVLALCSLDEDVECPCCQQLNPLAVRRALGVTE